MRVGLLLPLVLGSLIAPGVAAAQPRPEHKRLEPAVGKWRVEVDIKPSPLGPASKLAGTEDCQWFVNLHVICRTEATGPGGLYTSIRTLSYLPFLKQYGSYTVDSLGNSTLAVGQVSGNTWTFTADLPGVKTRSTVKTSQDSYTGAIEYLGPDGKWIAVSEIKAARMK